MKDLMNSNTVTMSSVGIAELTCARKDNVKITMERLKSKGFIEGQDFSSFLSESTGGRPGD